MESEQLENGLHCPYCGDILVKQSSGELTCARGEMGLSQDLEKRLVDCYVTRVRAPKEFTFPVDGSSKPFRIGGNWFCPGCGVAAQEVKDGDLRCPKCSHSLAEFMFALIELHPHRKTK